ncbi:MAG: hypothetical protein U0169_26375 [Polyangiaceae bacterium]
MRRFAVPTGASALVALGVVATLHACANDGTDGRGSRPEATVVDRNPSPSHVSTDPANVPIPPVDVPRLGPGFAGKDGTRRVRGTDPMIEVDGRGAIRVAGRRGPGLRFLPRTGEARDRTSPTAHPTESRENCVPAEHGSWLCHEAVTGGVEASWHVERDDGVPGAMTFAFDVPGAKAPRASPDGLVFGVEGASVRVGRGTWIDGRGIRTEIPARWNEGRVTWTVDADLRARTTFPAVLDPYVGSSVVVPSSGPNAVTVRPQTEPAFFDNGADGLSAVAWIDHTPDMDAIHSSSRSGPAVIRTRSITGSGYAFAPAAPSVKVADVVDAHDLVAAAVYKGRGLAWIEGTGTDARVRIANLAGSSPVVVDVPTPPGVTIVPGSLRSSTSPVPAVRAVVAFFGESSESGREGTGVYVFEFGATFTPSPVVLVDWIPDGRTVGPRSLSVAANVTRTAFAWIEGEADTAVLRGAITVRDELSSVFHVDWPWNHSIYPDGVALTAVQGDDGEDRYHLAVVGAAIDDAGPELSDIEVREGGSTVNQALRIDAVKSFKDPGGYVAMAEFTTGSDKPPVRTALAVVSDVPEMGGVHLVHVDEDFRAQIVFTDAPTLRPNRPPPLLYSTSSLLVGSVRTSPIVFDDVYAVSPGTDPRAWPATAWSPPLTTAPSWTRSPSGVATGNFFRIVGVTPNFSGLSTFSVAHDPSQSTSAAFNGVSTFPTFGLQNQLTDPDERTDCRVPAITNVRPNATANPAPVLVALCRSAYESRGPSTRVWFPGASTPPRVLVDATRPRATAKGTLVAHASRLPGATADVLTLHDVTAGSLTPTGAIGPHVDAFQDLDVGATTISSAAVEVDARDAPFVAWTEATSSGTRVRARFDATLAGLANASSVDVASSVGVVDEVVLATDGTSFLIVWKEKRATDGGPATEVIRASRVGPDADAGVDGGASAFRVSNPVVLSAPDRVAGGPTVVWSPRERQYVVAWHESETRGAARDIRMAWVDPSGATLDPEGIVMSSDVADESEPALVASASRTILLYTSADSPSTFTTGRIVTRTVVDGRALAARCTSALDCASRECVDGVCCNSRCDGACQRCDLPGHVGTCGDAPAGENVRRCVATRTCSASVAQCATPDTCDGHGACTRPVAAICREDAECASGFCTDGYCCESRCGGGCDVCNATPGRCTIAPKGDPGRNPVCASALCDGVHGECANACSSDAQCDPTSRCLAGTCVPAALGSSCAANAECPSGFCVDGVCCNARCERQCEACDLPSAPGQCSAVTGAPRGSRPKCESGTETCAARTCDGVRDVSTCVGFVGAEVACAKASCAAGVQASAARCDGKGACEEPSRRRCFPFACGAESCRASCVSDDDCDPSTRCDGTTGTCVTGATCQDRETLRTPTGESVSCAPYLCEATRCKESCTSIDECAPGHVCSSAGKCAPMETVPASSESAGCSSSPESAPSRPDAAAVLFAAVAALGVTRARRRRTRPSTCP